MGAAKKMRSSKASLIGKAVTMFNAACWGTAYIWSKEGTDALTAAGVENAGIVFGAMRFLLAAVCLAPWLTRSSCLGSAMGGLAVGTCYAFGYAAIFLAYCFGTTASKASFICSLQTLVIAGLTSITTGVLETSTLVAGLLAVTGVGILVLGGTTLDFNVGDVICLLAPVGFGLGWFILGPTMKKYPGDASSSTAIQLTCIGVVFTVWVMGQVMLEKGADGLVAWLASVPAMLQAPGLFWPLVCSAVLGNVLTMFFASEAMKYLQAKEVSIIVVTEPLWSVVSAVLILGETFGLRDYVGGGLILAAVLCTELWDTPQASAGRDPEKGQANGILRKEV
eukprot:TRINITY_DN33107_c0_g1_i1.p1 TRINITY_DN33107_c0_g1~~TRINITY_DN33107_c0_g1_i1.p1  ORF type:complete len:337 (-),score=60.36 TRINITY_DN33107_c0_g1_i1:442-1452(-)